MFSIIFTMNWNPVGIQSWFLFLNIICFVKATQISFPQPVAYQVNETNGFITMFAITFIPLMLLQFSRIALSPQKIYFFILIEY